MPGPKSLKGDIQPRNSTRLPSQKNKMGPEHKSVGVDVEDQDANQPPSKSLKHPNDATETPPASKRTKTANSTSSTGEESIESYENRLREWESEYTQSEKCRLKLFEWEYVQKEYKEKLRQLEYLKTKLDADDFDDVNERELHRKDLRGFRADEFRPSEDARRNLFEELRIINENLPSSASQQYLTYLNVTENIEKWLECRAKIDRPCHPNVEVQDLYEYKSRHSRWLQVQEKIKLYKGEVKMWYTNQEQKLLDDEEEERQHDEILEAEYNVANNSDVPKFVTTLKRLRKELEAYQNGWLALHAQQRNRSLKNLWVMDKGLPEPKIKNLADEDITKNIEIFIQTRENVKDPMNQQEYARKLGRVNASKRKLSEEIKVLGQSSPKSQVQHTDAGNDSERDKPTDVTYLKSSTQGFSDQPSVPEKKSAHTKAGAVANPASSAHSRRARIRQPSSSKNNSDKASTARKKPTDTSSGGATEPMSSTSSQVAGMGSSSHDTTSTTVDVTEGKPSQTSTRPQAAAPIGAIYGGVVYGHPVHHPVTYTPDQVLLDVCPKSSIAPYLIHRSDTTNNADKDAWAALEEPALPAGHQRGNLISNLTHFPMYTLEPYIWLPKHVLPLCRDWFDVIKQWNLNGIRVTKVGTDYDFSGYLIFMRPKMCSDDTKLQLGCTEHAHKALTKLTFMGFHLGKAVLWRGISKKEKEPKSARTYTRSQEDSIRDAQNGSYIPAKTLRRWNKQARN